MKNYMVTGLAALALAACAPAVPDSAAPGAGAGAGVGFGNYQVYDAQQAAREAELTGTALPAPRAVSAEVLETAEAVEAAETAQAAQATQAAETTEAALALEASAVLDATRPDGQVLNASPSNPPPAVINAAGISKENDFDAVGEQRSIEDDAARRAALKAQYQDVRPTAVPTRSGQDGPNIVAFALATSNPRGQGIYRRVGLNLQAKYTRNCAKYPSPDLAQSAFLARGGPERDRLGLDPDGDGYACSWDPAPFRAAKAAGRQAEAPLDAASPLDE